MTKFQDNKSLSVRTIRLRVGCAEKLNSSKVLKKIQSTVSHTSSETSKSSRSPSGNLSAEIFRQPSNKP